MKKTNAVILLFLIVFALPMGCSGTTDDPEEAGKTTVAICMGGINHPVHRIAQMAFITKSRDLGYRAIVSGLDEGSIQELSTKFESTITNGAKGVLLWAGDDAWYELMRNHASSCTFVVAHFAHEYTDTKNFISRNITSYAAAYGKETADFLVEKLAEKNITTGTLGISQAGPNVTENAASDAFRQRIAEIAPGFTCADTVYEGTEVAEAAVKVTAILQSYNDIVGGFGTTGGSAQSWTLAMQDTQKTGLVVVAVDYTEYNIGQVRNGTIAAIVAQPLYEECQEAAVSIDAVLNGADFTTSADEWLLAMEAPLAYIGGEGVNDIEYYEPLIHRVLDSFTD